MPLKPFFRLLALLFLLVGGTSRALGEAYRWTNFVGRTELYGSLDGVGNAARFNLPNGVATDGKGNVFVADSRNHIIRKITSSGVVTTFAGTAGSTGITDGTGSSARFNGPNSLAVDQNGNLYVSDTNNHTIRKITSGRVVSTLAGSVYISGNSDGIGTAAQFYLPMGVAVDGNGNVYVSDFGNYAIRRITSAGVVTTLAGMDHQFGSIDGPGSSAQFKGPSGIAVDGAGNVYVADLFSQTIRRISTGGVVTTLAGKADAIGKVDATGSQARFTFPSGLAVDGSGNVYVSDSGNSTIRKITSAGVVTTVAGSPGISGYADGSSAQFYGPQGVAVDGNGTLIVADTDNHVIRRITSDGVVTTLAGNAVSAAFERTAWLYNPVGIAIDRTGNLYVADASDSTIRKITSAGVVTTLAGLSGQRGNANGIGDEARFVYPSGVAVDDDGNVYVADTGNSRIRKITSDGVVTTLAGSALGSGSSDGLGSEARFSGPTGVAVDGDRNLYVADRNNHTIRKITSAGVVSTLAGMARTIGSANGIGSEARFYDPTGVAVDSDGNVYVAEFSSQTIRKITSGGIVTTLAGSAGTVGTGHGSGDYGSTDGTGSEARFGNPSGVAVDANGNVYVADSGTQIIRKITSAGMVTTIGGTPGVIGTFEGIGMQAQFNVPRGVASTSSGVLYVVNTNANSIFRGTDITEAPTLSAPVMNALSKNPLNVAFTLPETALAGSVQLSFTGSVNRTLTLAGSQEKIGAHSFSFDPAAPTASAAVASGSSIPDGIYTVTLSYQDMQGNQAASEFSTDVVLDTTAPTLSSVTIASNNIFSPLAMAGQTVALNFTSSEPFQQLDVTLLGVTAVVTNAGGNHWIATATINRQTSQGAAAFSITATDLSGNIVRITETTDQSNVTVLVNAAETDRTAPVLHIRAPLTNPVPGLFTISGTVNENLALKSLTVKLNGVPLALDAPLAFIAGANTPWQVSGAAPENGINHLVVEAEDFAGAKAITSKIVTYTNRRSELAGVYLAVLMPGTTPNPDNTGLVSVSVTATGSFSGKLIGSQGTVPFAGILGNDGTARFKPAYGATLSLVDKAHANRMLGRLSFSLNPATGIGGTLTVDDSVPGTFTGRKAPYNSKTPVPSALLNLPAGPAPKQGIYNIVFQPAVTEFDSASYPHDNGYARLTLKKTGAVLISGSLADGTKYSATSKLRADQSVPLFIGLYKKGGSFSGDLVFADLTDSKVSGHALLWLRPPDSGALYPAGWPEGIRVEAFGISPPP
ncbi:MAG: repeat containing protein [Chthoniobacteraceae bacterium]|nr:repeat containing protein [Chthoniobacteraceae bacterium]